MLTTVLLIIIGAWLKAPVWYFILCGTIILTKIITFGWKMYKAGHDE